ncbi:MAG: transposase [Verrucomicrobia bacterium]|nr:transposase [Verrucomicrobiota bacterium]
MAEGAENVVEWWDMRVPRIQQIPGHGTHFFHCMSRVVDRRHCFEQEEKEQFVKLLWEYATFCGIRVLNYCVMSNHFHLELEVPPRPSQPLSAEAFLKRLAGLSASTLTPARARQELEVFQRAGDAAGERAYLERKCRDMWSLSGFMKRLKGRFTQWFNRRHGRRGTLWEERFKSVLVQGSAASLLVVAWYLDLNPIRARIVTDPGLYPWCGYGAALTGSTGARLGIQSLMQYAEGRNPSEEEALAEYRQRLFQWGEAGREGTQETGEPLKPGFSPEQVLEVLKAKGQVRLTQLAQVSVRYLTQGIALGDEEFVEAVYTANSGHFGPRRKTGARRMRGVTEPLYTLRDFRRRVFH